METGLIAMLLYRSNPFLVPEETWWDSSFFGVA